MLHLFIYYFKSLFDSILLCFIDKLMVSNLFWRRLAEFENFVVCIFEGRDEYFVLLVAILQQNFIYLIKSVQWKLWDCLRRWILLFY